MHPREREGKGFGKKGAGGIFTNPLVLTMPATDVNAPDSSPIKHTHTQRIINVHVPPKLRILLKAGYEKATKLVAT